MNCPSGRIPEYFPLSHNIFCIRDSTSNDFYSRFADIDHAATLQFFVKPGLWSDITPENAHARCHRLPVQNFAVVIKLAGRGCQAG